VVRASIESSPNVAVSVSPATSYRYPSKRGKLISWALRSSSARTRVGSGPGFGSLVEPLHGIKENGTPAAYDLVGDTIVVEAEVSLRFTERRVQNRVFDNDLSHVATSTWTVATF